MVAVLVVYAGCAIASQQSFAPTSVPGGFQNYQAESLAHGDLALELAVPKGLSGLRDPYDPVANVKYRVAGGLHDLSYFKGHLYSYFGLAPVVLVSLPFHLITGAYLPSLPTTLLFAIVGFAFLCGVWFELARLLRLELSARAHAGTVVVLGLGSGLPWLVFIGRAYEVPIAAGFALLFSGAYFLLRMLRERGTPAVRDGIVAGACFGMLVGARPQLVLATVIAVVTVLVVWRSRESKARSAVAGFLVAALVVSSLFLLANQFRFGSFSEFGSTYQLSGINSLASPRLESAYLADAAFWYGVAPPQWLDAFPFFALHEPAYFEVSAGYTHEGVVGIVWLAPYIVCGLVLACVASIRSAFRGRWLVVAVTSTTIGVSALIFAINGVAFRSATMRYQLDYLPLLCVAAVIGWWWGWTHSGRAWARNSLLVAMIVTGVWTVAANLLITQTDCRAVASC
jgi:hypothetical protein